MSADKPTSANNGLKGLRREIDTIDREIHDLIMARTAVVERVRAAKEGEKIKIRPAREAKILTKLLARHKGPFPKRELIRIWREMIVATLSMEGPFSVAVLTPQDDENAFWDMARDQYGSFSPISRHVSARRVVEAARTMKATVGIVSTPERNEDNPWWPGLANNRRTAPNIIARLPMAGPGNTRGARDGFVLARIENEKTGRDRSFLIVETRAEISRQKLGNLLRDGQFDAVQVLFWHDDSKPEQWLHLVEVNGFVAPDDRRIKTLIKAEDDLISAIHYVGGYAMPFTADELATKP